MKKLSFVYDLQKNQKELSKLVSFISPDITGYEFSCNELCLYLKDDADEQKIANNYDNLFKGYLSVSAQEEIVSESRYNVSYISDDEIYGSHLVHKFGEGVIGFSGDVLKLFRFFASAFLKIALELDAAEKYYPTLLPIDFLKRRHISNHPHSI